MKKILKGALCALMSCAMLVGCSGKTPEPSPEPGPSGGAKTYDTETRVMQLATGALDGNFNPFFYTSQNDGNILSMTQIGMLTTDENGKLVCGEDQACVVLDYTTTMYTTKQVGTGEVTSTGSSDGRTEYEFLIKKGIKFSDGVDLTIKDVLFNLYVYLDPAYTGSATIYSTDIQGLKAYRAQDATLADDSDVDIDATFVAEAQARIINLVSWAKDTKTDESSLTDQMAADLETVKGLFLEEATSDWISVEQSWYESYKDTYRFTEAWQAYLFNEEIIQVQTTMSNNGVPVQLFEDVNGNGKRDDGELYYTTLDPDKGVEGAEIAAQQHIDGIAEATSPDKVQAYMSAHNCDESYAKLQLQKEYCVELVYKNYTDKSQIANILTYWATATNALEEFAGQARSAYYQSIKDNGELPVKTISGITTKKVTTFNGTALDGEYDVLKIVINGVDPKAIYNFGFTVAPLHYYSGEYNGVDYVAQADGNTHFGVDAGNKEFFDSVIQATEKNGLPVGAGAYQATNSSGGNASRSTFFENNIVYFKRNDYFYTLGSGIDNAKIKFINYKVLSDDKIMDALTTRSIDFGTPNATPSNVNIVSQNSSFLSQVSYRTGGYGYVGINPKYVPEVTVRQAIMKAMDTTMTIDYYGESLAEIIYRPMSITSWAYPKGATEYPSIAYAMDDSEITALVESSGYVKENGKYVKRTNVDGMANAELGSTLKLTFTIAGETTDHPAYQMFCNARDRLNALGFDITVQTDIQALKKMNSGQLAVWAAAWSSAVDPDPYQVYHKDSNATSVYNWNYPNILKDSTGKWVYEQNVIDQLSSLIDQGRETLVEDNRKSIYADCLDLIMDLAVELPTYQRNDLCVYNKTVIDSNSLVKNPSYNMGLFDKIWEIDYV